MKTLEDMDKLTNEIEYLSEKHKKIAKSIIKTLEENDLTVLQAKVILSCCYKYTEANSLVKY